MPAFSRSSSISTSFLESKVSKVEKYDQQKWSHRANIYASKVKKIEIKAKWWYKSIKIALIPTITVIVVNEGQISKTKEPKEKRTKRSKRRKKEQKRRKRSKKEQNEGNEVKTK